MSTSARVSATLCLGSTALGKSTATKISIKATPFNAVAILRSIQLTQNSFIALITLPGLAIFTTCNQQSLGLDTRQMLKTSLGRA